MTKFEYNFYYILHQKKKNKFEVIFNEISNQLNIYRRQFELTLKSYKKEWDDEISSRDSIFEEQKSEGEKVYDDIFEKNSSDDHAHQYAMYVSGLDYLYEEHASDLERINNEYQDFLDLYSKSILIALYSLNETKLNEITEIASEVFQKKIKPSHFNNRDYLKSSLQYLNLVVEIDTSGIEKYISKLKDLQFLRNNIVHNDSKFSDIELAQKIIKKQKDVLSIGEQGRLRIKGSKFIKDIFNLLSEFYEHLLWLIDLKQDSVIIKDGIIHWFKKIDQEIKLEDFSVTIKSINEKVFNFKMVPKKEELKTFQCRINLIRSTSESFERMNQSENQILKEFLDYENELKGMHVREIFNPFIQSQTVKIKLMVY